MKHLLDTLGIECAYLIGHSFGADIALHFCILFPERVDRLVLVEPGIAAPLLQAADPDSVARFARSWRSGRHQRRD